MEIVDFNYRKPTSLAPLYHDMVDGIALHHTGNNNSIYTNTDYHIDVNGWSWLGYNFYIANGVVYKVRGLEKMGAGVSGENNHLISIAIQGNYDKDAPSDRDIELLQTLIFYLKEKIPSIISIKPHKHYSETTCPGRFFPWRRLKLVSDKKEDEIIKKLSNKVDILSKQVESNKNTLARIIKALDYNNIRPER